MQKADWVDAHCHLSDLRFDDYREKVLQRAVEAGVGHWVQGGYGPADWRRQVALTRQGWHCSFGLHPWFVAENDESTCERALALLPQWLAKSAALGELGLDHGPRIPVDSYPRQYKFFEAQLSLARQTDKPLVLHVVRAHSQVLAALRKRGGCWRGIVHGFSASFETARQYTRLGLTVSVGGGLTRPGFKKLKTAVKRLDLKQIVLESDAPDQPPRDWQGLNEPASIVAVAAAVAQLRGGDVEEILNVTSATAKAVFSIAPPLTEPLNNLAQHEDLL